MIATRFVAYPPGSDIRLGLLPAPVSWTVSTFHNGVGALTLTYSSLAAGGPYVARALEDGLDIGFEVNWLGGPNDWAEPYDCRFLRIKSSGDPTDPTRILTLTCPSYGWLMGKVLMLNEGALEGSKSSHAGQRKFSTKDAGDIVKTMLDEHEARRGVGVPITRDSWTASVDSAGAAWAKKKTVYVDLGANLDTVLQAQVDMDHCDWRFQGRSLQMWNADSHWIDLSATVRLRLGREVGEAPSDESMEDVVTHILVKGDKKKHATVQNESGPKPWGFWEGLINESGLDTTAEMQDAAQKQLSQSSRLRGEYTRTLNLRPEDPVPFKDYRPGDWVAGPTMSGALQRMRVQQLTLTCGDSATLSGSVVLNDLVKASELALASKLTSVTGGADSSGGSGYAPDPDGPDVRQPAAPTGLTLSQTLYVDVWGRHQARLSASWSAVTTATDGTALDIQGYELWGQPQTTPASTWRRLTQTTGTTVTVDPFEPGSEWLFAVQAIGVTTTETGQQSAQVSIAFGVDETAPNTPSTPTVTPYLGTLVVGWNGKDNTGAAMPIDFALARVEVSTDGIAWSVKDRFLGSGTVSLSGLTFGVAHQVRLVALDLSGNTSSPSATASGTPESAGQILTGELLAGEKVVAGPPTGNHAELTSEGFTTYGVTPEGALVKIVRLGSGDVDVLTLMDATGNRTASISGTGAGDFKALSTDLLEIGGIDVTEMIDEASSRIVAGYLAIGNSANAAATEISYAELRGVLRPDRTYKMRVCPHKMDADSAGSVAEPRLRVAYDGAAVTTSSTLVQSGRRYADSTVAGGFAGLEYIFTTAGQSADLRDVRFGYNLARWSGSGNVWIVSDSTSPVVMYLEDCGPAIQFSSTVSTYTSTWRATEVYQNGITPKLGAGGFSIGHSFSDDWAQAVFAGNAISGETGKTIATALSGGTMVKAEVMSTLSPFEENSLINARFRTNTYTAANAAAPSGTAVDASKATSGTWRAWVDITANFTLTSRGIWVGGPDIGPAMMYADSGNDGFLVRLTYKR